MYLTQSNHFGPGTTIKLILKKKRELGEPRNKIGIGEW